MIVRETEKLDESPTRRKFDPGVLIDDNEAS